MSFRNRVLVFLTISQVIALSGASVASAAKAERTFKIEDSWTLRRAVEELSVRPQVRIGSEVTLHTESGSFTGEVIARNGQLIHLRTSSGSKIVSGPDEGKETAEYAIVPWQEVRAVSYRGYLEEKK